MTRPRALPGITYQVRTGCGKMYVICNDRNGRLAEVFIRLGSPGGCARAMTEAAYRLVSRALDAGVSPEKIIGDLAGIGCHLPVPGEAAPKSCMDAVAAVIRAHQGAKP